MRRGTLGELIIEIARHHAAIQHGNKLVTALPSLRVPIKHCLAQ